MGWAYLFALVPLALIAVPFIAACEDYLAYRNFKKEQEK